MYPVTVRKNLTVATAITVLQLKAGPAAPFEILSVVVSQDGSTTSVQEEICFVRKTAAATVTAGAVGTDVFKLRTNDPTPGLALGTAATGHTATVEGTNGDIVKRFGFNVLSGVLWIPVPEERVWVPGDGIIGLTFLTAPASHAWQFDVTIREYRG